MQKQSNSLIIIYHANNSVSFYQRISILRVSFSTHCKYDQVGCLPTNLCDIAHGYFKDVRVEGCVCQTARMKSLSTSGVSFTCPWDYSLTIIILACVICTVVVTPFLISWYNHVVHVITTNDLNDLENACVTSHQQA
ncbi:hypothetical protein SS50377_21857 [Spironucleus salmonicida]|uniref:Uncharacterized protein n=1 Tax=Spironucleus salmonicida TaxID=348837 RepID=V6LKY5_9EUKA|nr:hypothetical protein SS50377_21857 [Spironucleus salmonicida]|eukprot:EST44401.1 Hypothetical protein SS50377_15704 [Spironucleus salmonicida]